MTLHLIFDMIDDCCKLHLSLSILLYILLFSSKIYIVADAFDRDVLLFIFTQALIGDYLDNDNC
jgi:hypothetical protein